VLANRYDLSQRGSVSIAIRVPRELAAQLREAAVASGIDVSTYMRDALFAAPNITIAAVNLIQWEAAAAERELAESQMQSLRDEVARARADGAKAREQLETLECDLGQRPVHLLVLCDRVPRGETDARQEFTGVWGHLDPAARKQLLPAMLMPIREFLLAVPEAKPSSDDLARHRRVVADVAWLVCHLEDALGGNAPPGAEPATNAPATASAPASAVGRADATEDAMPWGGAALPSQSQALASLHGSYLEARSVGPAADDLGQVAGAAECGGHEGISADWALQAQTSAVSTSPTVADATGLLATARADLLGRASAPTSTTLPRGSGGAHVEVEGKGGEAHPGEFPPAPPLMAPQESRRQTARGWMPSQSEASADMWL
jgi:hypothetical protein